MTTKSSLLAAGASAAPGGVCTDLPENQPTAPAAGGQDFYGVLSQAFPGRVSHFSNGKNAGSPPATSQPNNSTTPAAQPNAGETQDANDAADDADTDASSAAKSSAAPADAAPTSTADASVMSALLAMMAQFTTPPVDARKAMALPELSLKAAAGDGEAASGGGSEMAAKIHGAISAPPAGSLIPTTASAAPTPHPQSLSPLKGEGGAADRKTASTAANAPPADIAVARKEAEGAATNENGATPQPVAGQLSATQLVGQISGNSGDGTGVALNGERMKSTVEKTEIAGGSGQKLPLAEAGTVASARSAGGLGSESESNSSLPGSDAFESVMAMDFTGKAGAVDFESSAGLTLAQPLDQAASQVERVAHLVNQEVMSLRQSGASTLAVSLKVDAHTELFLQVSSHNGQIAASIRCERGSLGGLDGHWGDLQESLARQNVQLLPLEVKASAGASAFDSATQNQSQSRETRELPQAAAAPAPAKTAAATKPKTKTTSRRGWESWA